MRTIFSIVVLFSIIFSSCKKNTSGGNPPPGGDINVYLAGNDMSLDGNRPCFWKNETRTNLSNTSGGDANSIFVNGSNVIVAGRNWLNNAQTRYAPCYWSNGSRTNLSLLDTRGDGWVRSILVFNGTMYAAGTCTDSLEYFANSGWRYLPVYWKDGQIVLLERLSNFGGGFAEAIGIRVAPNRAFPVIVGSSYAPSGYDEPCYWEIDPQITLPGADIDAIPLSNKGFGGAAKNLTVGGIETLGTSGLYIAGYVDNDNGYNDPCYWHNGARTDLSKSSAFVQGVALGIDVSEGNIYVVGYNDHKPCLWKNGTRTDLTIPANAHGGEATSCKVLNGDVYVAGSISTVSGEFPCYWKNGEIVTYNERGTVKSIVLSDK